MATFGKLTDGTLSTSTVADNRWVSRHSPSSSGAVTSLTHRMHLSGAGTCNFRGVIYADNAGEPGALLAVTDNGSFSNTSEAEVTANFSGANQITVSAGTQYWIGVHWEAPSGGVSVVLSRDGTSGLRRTGDGDTWADGTASTFGTATSLSGPIDCYVTYQVGSASSSVSPSTSISHSPSRSLSPSTSISSSPSPSPGISGLPTNPVGLYWESYYGVQSRIINIPTSYNIIFLFQATPNASPVGSFTFQRGATTATLNADIATCRARGQKVIMTCGGAGAQIDVTTQAKADAFIQSVKDTNVSFGGSGQTKAFDGIDWNNFETVTDVNLRVWMTYVSLSLKAYYGSDFLITAPPAVHGAFPGGQAEADRLLLATLERGGTVPGYSGSALDWFSPQFYDGGGNNTQEAINLLLDYYHTAVNVAGSASIGTSGTVLTQVPRNKIGIGFAIGASSTWWTTTNARNAYLATVANGRQPRGAFNFSANSDPTYTFGSQVAPFITNNTSSTSGSISSSISSSRSSSRSSSPSSSQSPSSSLSPSTSISQSSSSSISPSPSGGSDDPNKYLWFDGVDDYVEFPDSAALSPATTGTMTIAFTMRPDTLNNAVYIDSDDGQYVNFLGKGDYLAPTQYEWEFRMYNKDDPGQLRPNRISFYLFNLNAGIGVGSYFQEAMTAGVPFRVVGRITSTETSIFKNGVLKDTDNYFTPITITPQNGTAPLRVGTVALADPSFFKGMINDLIIWNRALSDSEVALDAAGTPPTSGMVFRARFDDGSGSTVIDDIGGNNGTRFGALWAPPSSSPSSSISRSPSASSPPTLGLVDHASGVGSPTSATTDAMDSTGANLIVLSVACDAPSTPVITDSKGNTWTPLTLSNTGGSVKTRMYYCSDPTVGTNHTFTATGAFCAIFAAAFAGMESPDVFDQENGATSDGTLTIQTGSVTPVENNELVITGLGLNSAGAVVSVNSGFTILDTETFGSGNNYGGALAYKIQTAAASENPTWTRINTEAMAVRIATFKSTNPSSASASVSPSTSRSSSISSSVSSSRSSSPSLSRSSSISSSPSLSRSSSVSSSPSATGSNSPSPSPSSSISRSISSSISSSPSLSRSSSPSSSQSGTSSPSLSISSSISTSPSSSLSHSPSQSISKSPSLSVSSSISSSPSPTRPYPVNDMRLERITQSQGLRRLLFKRMRGRLRRR